MKYYYKKIIIFSVFYLILIYLTGCWNSIDIVDLNIVSAIGIDKTSDNKIEFTVQIIKPDTISAQEQGSSEDATWTFSSTGETIGEAARNLLTIVDGIPLYSHAEILVISEDIAKEGIMDVLDIFERNYGTRRRTNVLISRGISAKEIVNAKSELESIPSLHIVNVIKNTRFLPYIIEIEIFEILQKLSAPGVNPVIGVIEKRDSKANEEKSKEDELQVKDLKVEGGAVFKKDKLIGWLDSIQTRGYQFVVDKVLSGIIIIPNPHDTDKSVDILLKKVNSKIDVQFNDGQPVLHIEIKIEANIGSQQGPGDLTTNSMVKKVEKAVDDVVEEEIRNIINLAQVKFKSDIFGFGEVMHRKHLSYWNKVKGDWDSEFVKLPVNINVEVMIGKSGLTKEPVEPK